MYVCIVVICLSHPIFFLFVPFHIRLLLRNIYDSHPYDPSEVPYPLDSRARVFSAKTRFIHSGATPQYRIL